MQWKDQLQQLQIADDENMQGPNRLTVVPRSCSSACRPSLPG